MTFIGLFDQIHAICILLKPNNSRITVTFEFCIKQLLCYLQKSASRNILFIFTNARSSNYSLRDTSPAFEQILDQIKNRPPFVEISLNQKTILCFDSESFRYLVATNRGIQLDSNHKLDYSKSWFRSTQECERLMDRVVSLPPNKVRDTISVNELRRLIVWLSQPLADITRNIVDNIKVLKGYKNYLKANSNDIIINKVSKRNFICL